MPRNLDVLRYICIDQGYLNTIVKWTCIVLGVVTYFVAGYLLGMHLFFPGTKMHAFVFLLGLMVLTLGVIMGTVSVMIVCSFGYGVYQAYLKLREFYSTKAQELSDIEAERARCLH